MSRSERKESATGTPLQGAGKTSIWQLFKERRTRDALYHAATYWDARAGAREGLARSLWPSNVYNRFWDERQRALIERVVPDVRGLRVLDVGCGTGRMCRHLLARGAGSVVGVDFSAATVELARRETEAALGNGLGEIVHRREAAGGWASAGEGVAVSARTPLCEFRVGDVVAGFPELAAQSFDLVLVLGCLSVACRNLHALERAFDNLAMLLTPGRSHLLLLEPIHRSPLLRRVLDLGIEEWVSAANRAGLRLVRADRMGLFPIRMVASVRDLPAPVVGPVFRAGEALLDSAPYLAPLADYKLLLFAPPA